MAHITRCTSNHTLSIQSGHTICPCTALHIYITLDRSLWFHVTLHTDMWFCTSSFMINCIVVKCTLIMSLGFIPHDDLLCATLFFPGSSHSVVWVGFPFLTLHFLHQIGHPNTHLHLYKMHKNIFFIAPHPALFVVSHTPCIPAPSFGPHSSVAVHLHSWDFNSHHLIHCTWMHHSFL